MPPDYDISMCLGGRASLLIGSSSHRAIGRVAVACAVMSACGAALPAPVTHPPVQTPRPTGPVPAGEPVPAGATSRTNLATGSLAGAIVSSTDRAPLARARVILTSQVLTEPRVTIAGVNGAYRFDRLPAGSYSLTASASGYAPQEYGARRAAPAAAVPLNDGQAITGIDIALQPAGVIAGQIRDEDGRPFVGAAVEALVSRFTDGQATLVSMSTAQTDDRGQFRLTGLPAGEYYVSALDPAFANVGDATGPLRYTPTYYPGVVFAEDATRVAVTVGVEPPPINFALKIIRPARVTGLLYTEDRRQLVSGSLIMSPIHGEGLTSVPSHDAMIRGDGTFVFRNAPPGRYQIRARGEVEPGGTALFATFKVVIEGQDITDVNMLLIPGASVSGSVLVEAVGTPRPAAWPGARVRAPLGDGSPFGDAPTGDVRPDGSYSIRGIRAGAHVIRVEGLPFPWLLKSVTHRGQDITDLGLEAESRQRFEDVRVTITDVASEVSGTVMDTKGAPVADAMVVILPLSQQFWSRTSRRFGLLRTDAGGRYRLRGLPAGEYRAIASIELDETEAYRRELLQTFSQAGVPLSLKPLEQRRLDLPLTSLAPSRW